MDGKDALGRRGEQIAACYLSDVLGWQILDRNWRCREGELDIVASDGQDVVACEVKTRSSTDFGTPAEAITPAKATRLWRLAHRWLAAHEYGQASIRIDVVGLVSEGAGRFSIDHLKGVC